jgi:hypothetical protein
MHLYIVANNNGVIEDTHQSLMHILAQFIRLKRMDAETIKRRKF